MKRQNPSRKKIVLGVTGTIGSGKTTVSRMLKSWGAEIIDADQIAHLLLHPASKVYQRIVKAFGRGILNQKGKIDKNKLAKMVFSKKKELKKLNRIMHPVIIRQIKKAIKTSQRKILVLDAPLLIEAGLKGIVDKIIVVKISRQEQLRRLAAKAALTKPEILRRIHTQLAQREKLRCADFIIDNNRTKKDTRKQLEQIRRLWWRN